MPPESTRHRLARYAATALILGVIGALFVRQQLVPPDSATTDTGPLDARTAEVGAPAPDFALRTLDGVPVRLADYRGKIVILNFWASWCTPCREEMADFQTLYRARGEASGDLVVLAVDYLPLDGERDVRRFIDGFAVGGTPLNFPILFDTPDGAVAERYGVAPRGARQAALPVSFFISRGGVLLAKIFGPVTGTLDAQLRAVEAAR